MERLLIELLIGPVLVAVATLVARRWGERAGGIVSAFPAVVGPVLLIGALGHGRQFASQSANAVLIGLSSFAAFSVAYGHIARRRTWVAAFLGGWLSAAAVALVADLAIRAVGSPPGVVIAALSLLVAYRVVPIVGRAPNGVRRIRPGDVPARMALTALLVGALASAADQLGPLAGGTLAALPVLASVLAVFTHRQRGSLAAIGLIRGMLAGMAGFVAFCEVVALLIVHVGIWPTFAAATSAAVMAQIATARMPRRAT